MKRVMLLLAVLILMSTVVFAGGTRQTTAAPGVSVIRWSYWGGEARLRAVQQAIDIYTAETGNIVAGEPAPGTNEHFQKFLTQLAGGNAVDIVQLGGYFSNLGIPDNGSKDEGVSDFLLPLDPYVKSGALNTTNVDTAAINAGTRGGVLYAIPVAMNMPAFIYNKDLLQRVGAPLPQVSMTWAEFETWLAAVKAKLPANTYVLTDNGATQSGSFFFGYWQGQNGTPQWDGTKTQLNLQSVQTYLDLWARWRTAGYVPPASVAADYAETNESTSSMIAGRTVVTAVWSNAIANYQTATKDELDLIEFPNAAVSKGLWGQMSQMMGINKKTKNPDAAIQFLNYYTNDARAWAILKDTYGMPVTPAGRGALTATATDTVKKQIAYLDVAGKHASPPYPNMPNDTEWNQGLFLIYQNVAYGRLTSAQGAQQVLDLVTRLTR